MKSTLSLLALGSLFSVVVIAVSCDQQPQSTVPAGPEVLSENIQAAAPTGSPSPSPDLGKDVMRPMSTLFGQVNTDLGNGAKNPTTLAALAQFHTLITVAEVTVPDTDNYAAQVKSLGAAGAFAKYQGMLQALDSATSQLSAAVAAAKTAACGTPCANLVAQIVSLESDGHAAFKDAD